MKLNSLGFVDTVIPLAVSAAKAYAGSKGGSAPGAAPGAAPGVPAPSGPVTVSPAMQQAFTPQFSPVMQMTQDSPGAVVSAAPTQYSSAGQSARTSSGTPGGAATPGAPGLPLYEGPPRAPGFPEAFPDPYARPVVQHESGGMTDLMKTGLLAVAAIGSIKLLSDRKKGKK